MLTPAFELSQDDKYVYVYIRTPYIKISDVEYVIEEHLFKFHVKPYFLRLNFPGKIVENGDEAASYDVDKGSFTVRLPKLVPGENFPDLDLVTKLLAPSGKSNVLSPGIEIISENTACSHSNDEDDDDNDDVDWEWGQEIYDEEKERELGVVGTKYGFANQKSGVFYRLKDELKDVVENPNPDELSYSERNLARIAAENVKFDEEHYLADFFEDERFKEISSYVIDKEVSFSELEKEKLRQFPNREYIFDNKEEISVCYCLVDIVFAFAYNKRTTLGENTVESAWTISKLSSTLSWFERFASLDEVLKACMRRSLSYPLYRNWELSCKVLQDTKDIFQLGRRKILKCLLEIFMLFNAREPRYLLNELYITDYCIWIQKAKERKLESLTKKLLETKITKDSVGWDLKDLETAAILVYNEEKCHASDAESNSCNDLTDDDFNETEGSDSTDSDTAGVEIVDQKALQCSEEARFCKDKTTKSFQAKGVTALSTEKSESDSKNEAHSEIKGLRSLFPGQTFGGKKLVEVLGGDEDASNGSFSIENASVDKRLCREDVEENKSKTDRTMYEEEKELVITEQEDTDQELSCKISELVMSEDISM